MTEATAPLPAFEPPGTLEERIARQDAALARLDVLMERNYALLRSLRQAGAVFPPDLAIALTGNENRLADLQGELRESRESRDREVRLRTVEEILGRAAAAQAPVPEPAPRRARHRASRRRDPSQPPLMRSVKGALPLGALGMAARHSWPAAHPVIAGTIATAAAGIAVTTAAVVPHSAATSGPGGTPAPAPAASVWSAAPLPVAGPGRIASAVTHPKGARSRTLTVLPPAPLPSYAPPDAPAPDSSQDPGSQPAPAQGTLSVSVDTLDVSGSGTGQFTVSCAGGPCDWHAVAGGPVSADVRQGTLQDGEAVTVTVTADPSALVPGGSGTVTVWPGDVEVTVSWSAPVVPSADPSPAVSPVLPSAPASAP